MKKTSEKYKFFESVTLCVIALGIYNFVTQFVLYPILNRNMGDETFGNVLTLISVLSVVSMSVGVGTNYSRLANKPRFETFNGDYNRFLCVALIPITVIPVVSLFFFENASPLSFVFLPLLSVSIMLRYYSEAEFRLQTNYRKNFVFYIILTVGSLLGLVFFKLTKSWETVILTGEILAIVFAALCGNLLKKPFFKKSRMHKEVFRSCCALSGSQFFCNLTLNADRLLINAFLTGTDVTVYYVASLLGKAMALLTGPVSGVLIGFLAKTKNFGRKQFLLCSLFSIIMGLFVFVLFIPLAPLIIGLLYPETAIEAKKYFLLANGGQIIYFISNLLLVIVLRFTKEKLQLFINVIYTVAFFAVSIPSLIFGNLISFCTAVLVLNVLRMLSILITGLYYSKSEKEA